MTRFAARQPHNPAVAVLARRVLTLGLGAAVAAAPAAALAHPGQPPQPHDLAGAWSADPTVLFGVAVLGWIYLRGVSAVWRSASAGRGVRRWQVVSFAGGMLALMVALVSPLDVLSQALFSAHMAQHLLLILAAGPLLAASSLELASLWALPLSWRRGLSRWWRHNRRLRPVWQAATTPAAILALHVGTMWAWHAPALYEAALGNEAVHALEHLTFLGSGIVFWWALLRVGRSGAMDYAFGVLYAFAAFLLSGLLGALLTFSTAPWYAIYLPRTAAWGMTPMQDQQLAGLIMWIPAGVVYSAAGIAVFLAWLTRAEQADAQVPAQDNRDAANLARASTPES